MSLKDAFYASVGVVLKGRDSIVDAATDFAKKNNLNAEEGEKFVKETTEHLEKKRKDFEGFMKSNVEKVVSDMGLVSRKEYDELKKECDDLRSKIKE